mgnify:CR=1 FL=1
MDTIIIVVLILSVLILLTSAVFILLYFKTEKARKQADADNLEILQNEFAEIKKLEINTASDLSDRFDALRKEIKLSQDQANAKMNLGFENLETENIDIRKEIAANITKLELAFKDYADKADRLLSKYSNDVADTQKEANQLKEQIKKELQNILIEIKSPLDLD